MIVRYLKVTQAQHTVFRQVTGPYGTVCTFVEVRYDKQVGVHDQVAYFDRHLSLSCEMETNPTEIGEAEFNYHLESALCTVRDAVRMVQVPRVADIYPAS